MRENKETEKTCSTVARPVRPPLQALDVDKRRDLPRLFNQPDNRAVSGKPAGAGIQFACLPDLSCLCSSCTKAHSVMYDSGSVPEETSSLLVRQKSWHRIPTALNTRWHCCFRPVISSGREFMMNMIPRGKLEPFRQK